MYAFLTKSPNATVAFATSVEGAARESPQQTVPVGLEAGAGLGHDAVVDQQPASLKAFENGDRSRATDRVDERAHDFLSGPIARGVDDAAGTARGDVPARLGRSGGIAKLFAMARGHAVSNTAIEKNKWQPPPNRA